MATRTHLAFLLAGLVQNIDLTGDELVLASVKVGGGSGTALTKAILDNLVALQNGTDFATGTNAHTHDGRYFTETELGAVSGTTGSDLIGDDASYSNFTPATTTVKGALSGIDAALASSGDGKLKVSSADTTKNFLTDSLTAGAGLSKSITNPAGDEVLDLAVNVDDSTIEISSDALRVKDLGITAAKLASDSVTTIKILNANVTTAKLADASVTADKLAAAVAGAGLAGGAGSALSVNVDDSTIEINSDTLRVKDAGITNAKIATGIAATKIANGSVSDVEFQYLDGVTSAIQTQINAKQATSEKGQANGYASLDGAGKVPVAQLPNSIMEYQGMWNATTNIPALADGAGSIGDVYRVSVAGTQDLGSGNITFDISDYAIYNGTAWEKADTTDAVTSVFGRLGVVVATAGDYTAAQITNTPAGGIAAVTVQTAINELDSEKFNSADFNSTFDTRLGTKSTTDLAEGTNLYFTDERAQDAVGTILTDSATVDFTYNDGPNTITAAVISDPFVNEIKKSVVAGEAMAADTSFLVRFAITGETAGRVYKASNAAAAVDGKFWAVGICSKASAVSAGDAVDMVAHGSYTLASSDTAFNAADVGLPLWLTTAGALSITPPSASGTACYKVGTVEATNKIWIGDKQITGIN